MVSTNDLNEQIVNEAIQYAESEIELHIDESDPFVHREELANALMVAVEQSVEVNEEEFRRRLSEARNQVRKCDSILTQQEQQLSALRERLEELRANLAAFEKEAVHFRNTLDPVLDRIELIDQSQSRRRDRLKNAKSELVTLEDGLESDAIGVLEFEERLDEVETSLSEISRSRSQLSQIEAALDELETWLTEPSVRLDEFEAQLENADRIANEARSHLANCQNPKKSFEYKTEWKNERFDAEDKISELRASLSDHRERFEAHREWREKSNFDDPAHAERLSELEERLADLEGESLRLLEQLTDLQENAHAYHDQLKTSERVPESASEADAAAPAIQTGPTGSFTRKPSNIELDIGTASQVIGESVSAAVIPEPTIQGILMLALCGTLYSRSKKRLRLEDGFIYSVGYEHRNADDKLSKDELTELVLEKESEIDYDLRMDEQDIDRAIPRLESMGCLELLYQNDKQVIHFLERCTSNW